MLTKWIKILKKYTLIIGCIFMNEDKENLLEKQIDRLNKILTKSNILEITTLIGNRKQLLWKNLIAGISRGVGIGIGVTLVTALLVILLQKIVTLNIPVIGSYISDIVEIVQKSRWKNIGVPKFFLRHLHTFNCNFYLYVTNILQKSIKYWQTT